MPPGLMLLHRAMLLSQALLLPGFLRLVALSAASVPCGALAAWILSALPPILRRSACWLLLLALFGAAACHAWLMQPPMADWTPPAVSLVIVVLILAPRLARLDPMLLEAAAASGASARGRLLLVVLPWICWTCLAAVLLCVAADAGLWLGAR